MQQTQINIYNERKQFRYGVEYVDNIESISGSNFRYLNFSAIDGDCFQFLSPYFESVKRETNKWTKLPKVDEHTTEGSVVDLPQYSNLSSVNVYFPSFGVETYTGNWLYVFSAHTYVNGDKIILCERLLDRREATAYEGRKEMHNIRYSEYINVVFPDPWHLTYSTEWEDFRHNICGEPQSINNTGSLLTIEIHPVRLTDKGDYVKLDNYLGGMNSLLLSDSSNVALSTLIDYESPRTVRLRFVYDTDLYTNGLAEYIQETYQFDSPQIEVNSRLTLFDNNNIYNVYEPTHEDLTGAEFDLTPQQDMYSIDFDESADGWDSFHPGLQMKVITELTCDELPLITLISNNIFVTQDVFGSILANESSYDVDSLNTVLTNDNDPNIDNSYMENINMVNKTTRQIINIEKPNDFKNNLTRPVFIRAQKNNDIIIHPSVTENISINLREYKNYVETFTLRIADTDFTEYGRQSSNIIFKVVGKQLPEDIEEGTYYVLDDNNELVTSGPYYIE